MTTEDIKETEIIFHLKDGTRLHGVTDNQEVAETIVDHVTFNRIIGESAPEKREFKELIANEKQ